MSKSELIITDDRDFRKASQVEKFRLVLLDVRLEEKLLPSEYDRWQKIQYVFALCFKQYDQTKAIRVIRNQVEGADRYEVAKRLYDEMAEVYGPVQRRNKDLARAILVQRLWSLGVRLEQAGKHYEAAEIFEKAGRMEGLDRHDEPDFDPESVEMPPITLTSDPRYLNAEDAELADEEEEEE